MKKVTMLATLVPLMIIVNACAPSLAPVTPTLTASPPFTPTISSTPVVISTPTLTITPSPLPSSTASYGFRRISINQFLPNLSFEIPISFEIPQDYVWRHLYGDESYYWVSQKYAVDFLPNKTSYFEAAISPNITYDSQTDRFDHIANNMSDKDQISLAEYVGTKINRIERKNIGEFPVLILEFESPYETDSGVVVVRPFTSTYIATLVEGQVLWIGYDFSLPATFAQESAIWEHFESSLERN